MGDAKMPDLYTTSFAFFEALWDAGVRYCFVNLGSDHPSIIEAMVKGQKEKKNEFPRIITCPNEMVALSMADGYARYSGKPQAVIVHVDVGTQALAAAVHNASCGRAPVLIFAGLSPYSFESEHRGSRTEYIHWIQDVPDQKAIVSQYCRYTGEIKTGKNVKQLVNRALTFARSDPQGPVYLCGAREPMEQDIEPYTLDQKYWEPVEPPALPLSGVKKIAEALVNAKEPLLITGYSGRNHDVPPLLVKLADTVKGLRVLDTGGSDMNFPANHRAWLGLRYGVDESIKTADMILVLDCDVPWINHHNTPRSDAVIYHVDVDPIKQQMPVFYINALARYKASSFNAITQILDYIESNAALKETLSASDINERWERLGESYTNRLKAINSLAKPKDDGTFLTPYLISRVRHHVPQDTIFAVEAVTNGPTVSDHLQVTIPGSLVNCGGGGLGWSGGGTLGVKLATDDLGEKKFVCQIVGDGTYLFSVPGSVYWISARYSIPVLTIVLNNKGWNAPRKSLELVHPHGLGSKVDNKTINISFEPTPDYAGIAKAAAGGNLYAGRASTADELERVLKEAVESVKNGVSAVVDCQLDGPQGKFNGEGKSLGN
ncbi:uncharacterized protein PV09_06364 [Verruconis gallopava]|uniref:Uncharacterized protein n=1 Tax=Verruconis gallopava TaxID=253628 RepID=A0A0D2A639_9PEZI|nr:uncharacterized protein PV09_06364 [Verruconis gallopava]KIW02208.1 hypothetical protein PV09_06364 [Verruconis gallopava]